MSDRYCLHSDSKRLVGAIDEGTSSARFILFEAGTSNIVAQHQVQISKQCPREGWVEQDPQVILNAVTTCIDVTVEQLKVSGGSVNDIACVGITNQRESTVVWAKDTGRPLHPVLVWLDMRGATTVDHLLDKVPNRTRNVNYLKPLCGLPLSPYFSAVKLKWLTENSPSVSRAISQDNCLFGTIDSFLIYNLTGGPQGGLHVTDVTNAHRTSLLNLSTLTYDPVLLKFFDIPPQLHLPEVHSSSEILGFIRGGPLDGVPIGGCLGDQMAALVGQQCLNRGQAKATYGTGCFLLYNTGSLRVDSASGMLTTIAYQMGKGATPTYALEGSCAVAGAAFAWLTDGLDVMPSFAEMANITSLDIVNDVVFVPAFSGLYAPYWRQDARGVICGISQDTNRSHIVRAAMDALCFQTRDLLTAMERDTSVATSALNVDGGVTSNSVLMQLLADVTGVEVRKPEMAECTALGAAICAGTALDVWPSEANRGDNCLPLVTQQWRPRTTANDRDVRYNKWNMAVERAIGWLT